MNIHVFDLSREKISESLTSQLLEIWISELGTKTDTAFGKEDVLSRLHDGIAIIATEGETLIGAALLSSAPARHLTDPKNFLVNILPESELQKCPDIVHDEALTEKFEQSAYLSLLVVHPDYRRQGIGTALLEKALALSSEGVGLLVMQDLDLVHWYGQRGFTPCVWLAAEYPTLQGTTAKRLVILMMSQSPDKN